MRDDISGMATMMKERLPAASDGGFYLGELENIRRLDTFQLPSWGIEKHMLGGDISSKCGWKSVVVQA